MTIGLNWRQVGVAALTGFGVGFTLVVGAKVGRAVESDRPLYKDSRVLLSVGGSLLVIVAAALCRNRTVQVVTIPAATAFGGAVLVGAHRARRRRRATS